MRDIRNSHEDAGERSIRNIPLHRRAKHAAEHVHQDDIVDLPRRRRRMPKNFWLIALGVVAACAFFGLLLSTVFAGATITVYPRTDTVTLPETLLAQPNAPVGVLPYQTVSVTRLATVSVPASGTKMVSRPASGVLTISNSFSSASQRLIANTRFEAEDGKIYRIRESVTVPGATGTGQALKPGTISATVYADSPGPSYNKSAGETFTIPGFKGSPRYSKFSAASGGAISGGFTGDEPAIADSDLAAAKTSLQQKLDADVRAAATAEIPSGFIAIPGTLDVSFMGLTQTPSSDKTATISQSATATGIIIRQSNLASAIARSEIDQYQGEAVLFGDASTMDISIEQGSKRQDGAITLVLKGKTVLVWQFDKEALLSALVGKGKSEFQDTMQAFRPAVDNADVSIRPFWQGKFPSDPAKITIKVSSGK